MTLTKSQAEELISGLHVWGILVRPDPDRRGVLFELAHGPILPGAGSIAALALAYEFEDGLFDYLTGASAATPGPTRDCPPSTSPGDPGAPLTRGRSGLPTLPAAAPLVAGGQGRHAGEVEAGATVAAWCFAGLAVVGLFALLLAGWRLVLGG